MLENPIALLSNFILVDIIKKMYRYVSIEHMLYAVYYYPFRELLLHKSNYPPPKADGILVWHHPFRAISKAWLDIFD